MAQFFVNQKCQRRNNQAFDQIKGHRAEKNVGVDAVDQGIHFVAGRHNRVNRHEFGVNGMIRYLLVSAPMTVTAAVPVKQAASAPFFALMVPVQEPGA